MSEIYITDENSTDELSYCDVQSGTEMADELIGNSGGYNMTAVGYWEMPRRDFDWWEEIFARMEKMDEWADDFGIHPSTLCRCDPNDGLEEFCDACESAMEAAEAHIARAEENGDLAPVVAVHPVGGDVAWNVPDTLTVIQVDRDDDGDVRMRWLSERDGKRRDVYLPADEWGGYDMDEAKAEFERCENCECVTFEER